MNTSRALWAGAVAAIWLVAGVAVATVARHAAPPIADSAARPRGPVYGLASAGLSYPFAAAVARGFMQEAARRGVAAVVLDAKGDLQKQANDIDDLIGRRPDGIAIMPLDSIAAQGMVDRLAQKHIPAVAVAALVGDPRRRAARDVYPALSALVAQDEVEAGRTAGHLAARLLPREAIASVAVIEGAAGFPEVEQRARGFAAGLRDAGVQYRLVASQPGNSTAEGGEAACQNILAAHPDVALLFNEADDMVIGCARAVRSAGSRARLVGIGGSRLALASLRAGAIDGTVCFRPEALGALALDSLIHPPPAAARFLTYPFAAVTRRHADECVGQW